MIAIRATNIIASGVISLGLAVALFAAAQTVSSSGSASHIAPIFGSAMLDMEEETS